MSKVIFSFNGIQTIIQCLKEDKMESICKKFASKIDVNINSIYFLYGGNKLNLELNFNQLTKMNEINILVFQYENNEEIICPKCGEKIKYNKKLIDNILLSNNDIIEILIGLKGQIENIINDIINRKAINYINGQLKTINIVLNNTIGEIKKINEQINILDFEQNSSQNKNGNIITGLLDIKLEKIKNSIILFKKDNKEGIDVYINNNKVNMIHEENKWIIDYMFQKYGKYEFKIVFNKIIDNLQSFFEDCSNLYSIDLSNFDSSQIFNMAYLFNRCNNLREIKGLNILKTNNVTNMRAMFQGCNDLEYLDLSNFDTSNVMEMVGMFNGCNNLKEIKGINNLKTNNVINMSSMFQYCNKLEYLDLSIFDTSKTQVMDGMFNECNKLKEIKGINNFKTSNVYNMRVMFQCCKELEYLDLSNFDTSKVCNMAWMFNECKKLKEIKGINYLKTNKVTNMRSMFQRCYELEYLDLSNFNTSNVMDMAGMFNECNKLKYLNILNFNVNDSTENMFDFENKKKCKFLAKNKTIEKLYYS